jgi:hypothetical protein
VQRGDAEVVALEVEMHDADRSAEVRFPAPWPRHFGSVTVPPDRHEEGPDRSTAMSFGGGGSAYAFACEPCGLVPVAVLIR